MVALRAVVGVPAHDLIQAGPQRGPLGEINGIFFLLTQDLVHSTSLLSSSKSAHPGGWLSKAAGPRNPSENRQNINFVYFRGLKPPALCAKTFEIQRLSLGGLEMKSEHRVKYILT